MHNAGFRWTVAAMGVTVLLAGCVGTPQTFSEVAPEAMKPIVLKAPAAVRAPARPLAPARALSQAEKERLFREFQRSQILKTQAATSEDTATP